MPWSTGTVPCRLILADALRQGFGMVETLLLPMSCSMTGCLHLVSGPLRDDICWTAASSVLVRGRSSRGPTRPVILVPLRQLRWQNGGCLGNFCPHAPDVLEGRLHPCSAPDSDVKSCQEGRHDRCALTMDSGTRPPATRLLPGAPAQTGFPRCICTFISPSLFALSSGSPSASRVPDFDLDARRNPLYVPQPAITTRQLSPP